MAIRYTVFDDRGGMMDGWCIWDNKEELFVKRTCGLGMDDPTDDVLTFKTRREARSYAWSLNAPKDSATVLGA